MRQDMYEQQMDLTMKRTTDAKSKLNAVLQDVRQVQDRLTRERAEMARELERLDVQEKEIIEA